jgi:uncharacterized protein
MGRRGVRAFVATAIVVAVVLGLLWSLQRRLIYFPNREPPSATTADRAGARAVALDTSDGLRLAAWLIPPVRGDRGVGVLVAPGNGGNRQGRLPLAAALAAEGFHVLLLDYRGYGGNPGRPSETGLARDARAGWEHLTATEGLPPHRVILFGESLGGGVVTALAADLCTAGPPPGGLVLRSPFTSLAAVGREHYPLLPVGLLLRDRYDVLGAIPRICAPVAVVYGTADTIVPAAQSAEVARAGKAVRVSAVPGADHNDPALLYGPEVVRAVIAVAERLDGP